MLRVKALLLICLMAWCGASSAESIKKEVPPVAGQAKAGNKSQPIASTQREVTVTFAPSSNLTVTGNLHVTADNANKSGDPEPSKWADPITWFTFCLVLVGVGQTYVLWSTVVATRVAAEAAKTGAESVMLAERAYVKMGHVLPGIEYDEPHPSSPFCIIRIRFKVKNFGKTPAVVSDVQAGGCVLDTEILLPSNPPYLRLDATPNAFLVPGEDFEWPKRIALDRLLAAAAWMGTRRLWVYGFVDYRDSFGGRHRSGWVRYYNYAADPGTDNLFQTAEGRYDYDRPRKPGEGSDWGDPAPV